MHILKWLPAGKADHRSPAPSPEGVSNFFLVEATERYVVCAARRVDRTMEV